MLSVCLALSLPVSARADGGGWPTATPTITPTSTPTLTPVPASVDVPPILPTSYPAPGSMITPPSIGQQVNAAGTPAPTSTPTPTRLNTSASLTGGIACWPIAIIALVVGLVLFTWLRSGIRKGVQS
ncbi:MAG TPA: hypothetical protein VLM83_07020, partial [Anaerolineales bacterium]|nr:hypothetical protein [Anaerolineales bacterium]